MCGGIFVDLRFEIHGRILKRVEYDDAMNKNENYYKCIFTFEDGSDWLGVNKFAIFRDGWGNSNVVHLGNQNNILTCDVPNRMLLGSYFKVSIYGGELLSTNNVTIGLMQSGYDIDIYKNPQSDITERDIFIEIFERLDEVLDSITYQNKTLFLYSNSKLIDSVYLPFITDDEIDDIVREILKDYIKFIPVATSESDGLMSSTDKVKLDSIEYGANKTIVDGSLNGESDNPISNRVVTRALNGKDDTVERIDGIILELLNL